jgi:hypothetical protein
MSVRTLSGVRAIVLSRVGAMVLTRVGAIPLTLVGAIRLTLLGARTADAGQCDGADGLTLVGKGSSVKPWLPEVPDRRGNSCDLMPMGSSHIPRSRSPTAVAFGQYAADSPRVRRVHSQASCPLRAIIRS